VWLLWGRGVGLADMGLAAFFYLVTGFGVTVGYHRCLTHRSFTARPFLRVALAVAGSMSFQGDVIGWVATHRRHHAFTDRPGDPHSPYRYGTGPAGQLRGLLHAHVGWLFGNDPTSQQRYAPDILASRPMRRVSDAFPALCAVSLALPLAAGWALGGTWQAAVLALVSAGLVRVFLLQHVTWSVNSRGQVDLSAGLIRVFERVGWASGVRWPTVARLSQRRRKAGDGVLDGDDAGHLKAC
jgi:stearoyl-CoA desaturase (Delta-9 desaturase)